MKIRPAYTMAAALALTCGAPVLAQTVDTTTVVTRTEPIVVEIRTNPSSAIHGGAATYDDLVLAERVARALEDSRGLSKPGITATIVADKGAVTVSGSADNEAQAQRAMVVAKHAAAPYRVAGFVASSPG